MQDFEAAGWLAKIFQPSLFFLLVRKGPRLKRSISDDLTFWLLLGQAKSN
jgi:hypothetical protein